MRMNEIPFETVDWSEVVPTEHPGETGIATWRTWTYGDLRVRMVEYSPGYLADHWCAKGHVCLCVAGTLHVEIQGGAVHTLTPGMSYHVADGETPHRSHTEEGARLFIVD
jgi:hypothetical protein